MARSLGLFRLLWISAAAVGAVMALASSARADSPSCPDAPITPATPSGLAERVQLLEDYTAIEELKAAYGYAIDAVVADPTKIDDLLRLFTDNICLDYGPLGRFNGKAAVKTFFQTVVPSLSAWNFHVASHPILRINGSVASGAWRVVAHGVSKTPPGTQVSTSFARYRDRYEKTATGWKFRTITVIFDVPPLAPAP
ncbi:MAG: nuclear transport factor 2 family protein [Polyangia bacterium]